MNPTTIQPIKIDCRTSPTESTLGNHRSDDEPFFRAK